MVSEPVSEKFGTEKSSGTGLEKNLVPKKVSESVSKNFGTEKSPGIGLEKNLVPKKVSELVSIFFGTEKSIGTVLEKIWYRKVSEAKKFGAKSHGISLEFSCLSLETFLYPHEHYLSAADQSLTLLHGCQTNQQ